MTPDLQSQKTRALCELAPVIPVLVVADAARAEGLATALVAGGLPVLEVTLRTPAALDVIRDRFWVYFVDPAHGADDDAARAFVTTADGPVVTHLIAAPSRTGRAARTARGAATQPSAHHGVAAVSTAVSTAASTSSP